MVGKINFFLEDSIASVAVFRRMALIDMVPDDMLAKNAVTKQVYLYLTRWT